MIWGVDMITNSAMTQLCDWKAWWLDASSTFHLHLVSWLVVNIFVNIFTSQDVPVMYIPVHIQAFARQYLLSKPKFWTSGQFSFFYPVDNPTIVCYKHLLSTFLKRTHSGWLLVPEIHNFELWYLVPGVGVLVRVFQIALVWDSLTMVRGCS